MSLQDLTPYVPQQEFSTRAKQIGLGLAMPHGRRIVFADVALQDLTPFFDSITAEFYGGESVTGVFGEMHSGKRFTMNVNFTRS